eukprot:Blabericola_migrator_1__1274@NODE_132_length_13257_cov_135_196133_g116_i0_p5_GENE_NODE_132_length_13257_cov_135_196133_g116_i0NODE_132_length_13257_cov_135_196133_g116_i0_p5_ORF_typecomplete_len417_score50_55_NODE_132_length_13257_cov_135_196133_g116_i052666516
MTSPIRETPFLHLRQTAANIYFDQPTVTRRVVDTAPSYINLSPLHTYTPPTPAYSYIPHTDDGPLRWTAQSLPLPCAYLRLPWPRGRSFARLLPSRQSQSLKPAAMAFRQFVKKMMVEEVCLSPPLYLLRYVHLASPVGPSDTAQQKAESRLLPFVWARKAFPAIQAVSLQRWTHEGQDTLNIGSQLKFTSEIIKHVLGDDDVYTAFTPLPPWDQLPLSYKDMEKAFLDSEAVAKILDQISAGPRKRRGVEAGRQKQKHLVVCFDASGRPYNDWTPHNMRQIVHLVGQTVSVLSSLIPLYLEPIGDALAKTSHHHEGFASFQVIIFPPRKFNEGIHALRVKTPAPPTKVSRESPPLPADFYSDDRYIDSESDDLTTAYPVIRGPHHYYNDNYSVASFESRRLLSPSIIGGKHSRGI